MKYFITSKISENIHTTPEGYLVCIGVPIARTGEQVYADGEIPVKADEEGKILIDRPEAEVFRAETLASFEGKPVTIEHPEDFVGPDNWKELSKGIIQNVRRGKDESKDDVIADILITDSMAISLVKNGLREVSCGYECDFFEVEKGRGVQKGIIGNHLALVRRGRAGAAYAIMDHKGKGEQKMKLPEKIKAIFAKAQDDALKIVTDEAEGGKEEKKEDDKSKSKDAMAMDELVAICKDVVAKLDAMSASKDAAPAKEEKKDEPAKDAEGEAAAAAGEKSLEERLKALEMAVSKMMQEESDEEIGDEDGEVIGDEDAEDDDFEESTMTGDTASRVEILAPGLKAKAKDAKAAALKAAYATAEGKKVIEAINGGKAPAFDSAEKVDMLFIAASELMKRDRTSDLSKTRQTRDSGDSIHEPMTAERMNEINEKIYKRA